MSERITIKQPRSGNRFNPLKTLLYLFIFIICIQTHSQEILFSRSSGSLNSGSTEDILIYDMEKSMARTLLKGTVRGRGEYAAQLSTDNSKIIFNTYRYGGWKLALGDFENMRIQNVKRLTDRPNYEYNGSFSLDGTKIAYQEYNWSTEDVDIFIADINGENIIHLVQSKGGDRSPAWTNDSKAIVFTSGRSGLYQIYRQSLQESNAQILTDGAANYFAPSISNKDDIIAFLSDKEGELDLYVKNLKSGELTNLTSKHKSDKFEMKGFENSGCWAYTTSWSPDDQYIVCNLMKEGDLELFVVKSDGSEISQLTNNTDDDITPFWIK